MSAAELPIHTWPASCMLTLSQACDSCRQLKAKCDENKPCKNCLDKNMTCNYRDPAPKQ